mgnify:CR=1 FL=1
MHPPLPKPECSLRTVCAALVLVTFALMGCQTERPTVPLLAPSDTLFSANDAERSKALDRLEAMQQDTLRTAFSRLADFSFTRYVRTAQFAPDGRRTAFAERVDRYVRTDGLQRRTLRRDSTGTFSFDAFDQFAPTPTDSLPRNLPSYLISDEPAYIAPRTREAYRYRTYADTLMPGTPVHVVEVRAQPDERGHEVGIRHARLYIDPASQQLVGLYLVRAERAALFREDSRFFVSLRPGPDGGWLPFVTRFHARVDVPMRDPQEFRTVSTFYDYTPAD